jgi:hypothetical protein
MIQDILTHSLLILSAFLVLRSFVRFFTVKTSSNGSLSGSGHSCGSCDSSCSMKSIMGTIDINAKDLKPLK